MAKVLVPPPGEIADEILAAKRRHVLCARNARIRTALCESSEITFDAGDPLFIIEVMKMFNKVYAPFAGTIDEVLIEQDGVIIRKGQPLFRITPDESRCPRVR